MDGKIEQIAPLFADGHAEIDLHWISGHLNAFTGARDCTLMRLARETGQCTIEPESTVDGQLASFLGNLVREGSGLFSENVRFSQIPFSWAPCDAPRFEEWSASLSPHLFGLLRDARFHVFFRRCASDEDLILVAHSPRTEAQPTITDLFICQGIAQILFDRMRQRQREPSPDSVHITTRELECLRWSAEGKTSEEIALILSLSTHTVNHYLINATKKLNATNRMHAITTAIRLGVLDISRDVKSA